MMDLSSLNWRRIIVIGVIVIVVIWLGITCLNKVGSGVGSMSSPENTAKSAIMTLESKDGAKVAPYFTPIPGALMGQRVDATLSGFDTIDIQNLKCMLILQEGASARVQAVYDMVVTVNGAVSIQHCSKVIKLVQLEKKWYINEAF